MGLGSTAKTLQTLADRAEQLYEQIVELQQRIVNLEESVDETTDRVRTLEAESEKQTALLEAIAREQGIDVEQLLADAAIEEAEVGDEQTGGAAGGQSSAADGGAAGASGDSRQ